MSRKTPFNVSNAVQQFTAGGAALIFLLVTFWVAVETYDNLLFLQKRMAKPKADHQSKLDTAEREFKQKFDLLASQAEQRRKQAMEVAQKSLEEIQKQRNKLLAELDAAADREKARLRIVVDSETERRRDANEAKRQQNIAAAELKLKPGKEEVAKVENNYRNLTQQQVDLEVKLRETEIAEADKRRAHSARQEELATAEQDALNKGWIRGSDGKVHPPKAPEGLWERGKRSLIELLDRYNKMQEKLNEIRAASERANSAWVEAKGTLDECKTSLAGARNQIALWAGKLEDKRKSLERKQAEVADELRGVQSRMDDNLRAWKVEAETEYQADVGKLQQKTASDRASLRSRAESEEQDAYKQRGAAVTESYTWQDAAKIVLEHERSELVKKLGAEYQEKFKPWQKSETLRRLVGLLHVMTGLYALVLSIRCLFRWLQLRGWCSEQYLVCPP